MTTATATEIPSDAAPSSVTALHRAFTVQVNATTDAVRQAVERVLIRVRTALDLPSRGELASLTARLDAIDLRLAALAEPETDSAAADGAKDEDAQRPRARRKG